jgi:15-cis-phytoene synthase
MSQSAHSSAEIAKKSRSNLAFALACLPPARRRDMVSFYAFCRIVDDIADADERPATDRRRDLAQWRHAVLNHGAGISDEVLAEVVKLPERHHFPSQWLAEVIDGVASDIDFSGYETLEELLAYCYKVASVVGLVSARIFGATGTSCDEYAVKLGYAFQLTNILRDIGQDARENARIYLPLEELRQFGVSKAAILSGQREPGFDALMDFQFERASRLYQEAYASLPVKEQGHMIAARMMADIYHRILDQMKATGYQVLERRERLSTRKKALILARYIGEAWWRKIDD